MGGMQIVTDSVASIPREDALKEDIEVVSLYVNAYGQELEDATMDVDDFYRGISDMAAKVPTSSQPSQQAFVDCFERAAEAGRDVLGVFISSKMSGTFEGATMAARAVKERHPRFRCEIVDSTSNSYDEALPVLSAAAARDGGASLSACRDRALEAIGCSRYLFTPESLSFLKAGGRIGGAAALLGNLMKLAPVLTVRDGVATTFAKARTQKNALVRIMKAVAEDAEAHGLEDLVVHYIGDRGPAEAWARDAVAPFVGHPVRILPVSPVIGLHVGPAVGVAYRCSHPIAGKVDGGAPAVFSLS